MFDSSLDLDSAANAFTVDAEIPLGQPIRALGGSDRISGSENTDFVFGNEGADYLYGGLGADLFLGGRGADLFSGNQGTDQLRGERGNDVIYGGRDSDLLDGGEGDDFLSGDAGPDSLTGGDGSDAFVLDIRHGTSDRALTDVITDFSEDDGDVFALTDGVNDALTEADLTLETVGTDTFISLKATGAFLARVQGVSAEQLADTFSTVRATLDDTESGATVLGLVPGQGTLQGEVGDADYMDMFQFEVRETSIVNFNLNGLSADADLAVYEDLDADGELGGDEIISESVRSGNADETIENVTLKQGQYFLAVEQFEGDTSYNLSVAGVAGTVAQDLSGDLPSTARLLPPDGEVELHDYVGGTDAVDTYRLEVLNSGYLDLFTDYQDANLNLTLWSDRNGNNQLDADETIAQATNEIQQDIIDPGTYYVNVTAPGEATSYEIFSIASPGSRVDIENYNPLFPGLPTTGTLDQNDDFDPNDQDNYADPYLLSELGAGLTVTVAQQSEDFDAYLTVVDLLTGEVVAENDDIDTEGDNLDAQVSFTTEQGVQYVVYASSVDAPGVGDYTLNTTVTGTVTETVVSSASADSNVELDGASDSSSGTITASDLSSDSQGPSPVYKNNNLAYQPLTGGQVNSIPINAMHQGRFGDCFFMAALTATFGKIEDISTANSKESTVLKSAIMSDGNNYTIKFHNNKGEPGTVTVDNQVVTDETVNTTTFVDQNGNFVREEKTSDIVLYGAKWQHESAKPTDASGQPIWASIFERAFAKRQDGYDNISSGYDGYALAMMTGKGIEYISLKTVSEPIPGDTSKTPKTRQVYQRADVISFSSKSSFTPKVSGTIATTKDLFDTIQTALNQGRYVTAGTPGGNDQKSLYGGVLQEGHAYSVHNAYVDAQGRQMILVRNPWGVDNNSDAKAVEDPSDNKKDGFVAITFQAFLENFDGLSLSKG